MVMAMYGYQVSFSQTNMGYGSCISVAIFVLSLLVIVNFSYPKYFRYQDPHLTCKVIGDEIEVTASAYAKSIEILNENEDLILSDNYFDMNAGTKRVKIEAGDPSVLRLRSVCDIH